MNNSEVRGGTSENKGGLWEPLDQRQFVHLQGLHGLIRVLKRRSKWIIGSILICEILAFVITNTTKPVYEATATIELSQNNHALDLGIADVFSQQLSSGGDALLVDQQTETAILQGDSLALEVIRQLGLASQPPFLIKHGPLPKPEADQGLNFENSPLLRMRMIDIFKSGLKVRPTRGTRLIRVTYESHDPQQAAQIANALIESYKTQYLQSHYTATSETSDWLTKQLSDLKANVEDSEKKLTDFEKENGILSLNLSPTGGTGNSTEEGQIHSVVIQKLDALNAELTAAEANRIEKEAIYRLVQTNNGNVVLGLGNDPLAVQSNSMVLTQGGGLSNLQQLQQQQNELQISLADARTTFGANNRHLQEMQTQLRAVDAQIREEMQAIVRRAQADFQLAQQTENEIRQRFDQQQVEAGKLNEKTVQFAVLSQEAFSRKKLYEDLYTKLQEANVSAGIKATNVTIVDPARSQPIPIRPKRGSNLAMGMIFGIFVGLGTAYAAESVDRTVDNPLEIEEITRKPVIGVIPDFAEKGRTYGAGLIYGARRRREKQKAVAEGPPGPRSILMLDHPESAAAEAFRVLRTSIMLSRAGGGPKVILITSCTPEEGKTTIAINLAVAFAQNNKKVIIVEADMRRPSIARRINIPNKVGLSSVLVGSSTNDEAIHRGVRVPTLDVLPSGPHPPMPAEILGSAAFDNLIEQFRSQYDVVIIDSPPAFLVTDAVSISQKSDAVVWVSMVGLVTRPYLARAARMIERDGMPVVGIVANRIRKGVAGYGYGYEYAFTGTYYGEDQSGDS